MSFADIGYLVRKKVKINFCQNIFFSFMMIILATSGCHIIFCIIIMWCSIDSTDELLKVIIFARVNITLTKGTLVTFLKSGVEKFLAWLGTEPKTFRSM